MRNFVSDFADSALKKGRLWGQWGHLGHWGFQGRHFPHAGLWRRLVRRRETELKSRSDDTILANDIHTNTKKSRSDEIIIANDIYTNTKNHEVMKLL